MMNIWIGRKNLDSRFRSGNLVEIGYFGRYIKKITDWFSWTKLVFGFVTHKPPWYRLPHILCRPFIDTRSSCEKKKKKSCKTHHSNHAFYTILLFYKQFSCRFQFDTKSAVVFGRALSVGMKLKFHHNKNDEMISYMFQAQSGVICWFSRRQRTPALSSTETEFIGLTVAIQEARWLERFETEMILAALKIIVLYCDNLGAL